MTGRTHPAIRLAVGIAALGASLFLHAPARAANPQFLGSWGTTGTNPGQFTQATSLDPAQGNAPYFWVLDRAACRVQGFDPLGNYQSVVWGSPGSGVGQLSSPEGVTGDVNGAVWIADTGNDRIVGFPPPNTVTTPVILGGSGSGDGQFNQPAGLMRVNNTLYVVDRGNNRVQMIDPIIGFQGKWGGAGNGPGQFNAPSDVALDRLSGDVWVVDTGNDRIQRFTSAGVFVRSVGSTGSGPGQFQGPRGIAVDMEGIVYVADTGNNRVQAFRPNGSFITSWGGAGTGDYQFDEPIDVSVNQGSSTQARIFVLDRAHNLVKRYDDLRFPTPANSTIPSFLTLVAGQAIPQDAFGTTTIVLHDEHNDPMPGETVALSLGSCSDMVLSAVQPDPSLAFSCSQGSASLVTDSQGRVVFQLAGHCGNRATPSAPGCATIRAGLENAVVATLSVNAMDQDGMNGVDENDASLFLQDLAPHVYRPRSDYDRNGVLSVSDFSLMLTRIGAPNAPGTASRCDGGPTSRGTSAPIGGGLELTWADCSEVDGGAGTSLAVFTCSTNSSSNTLYATLTSAADIAGITGIDAVVEIRTPSGTALPPWWDIQAGCRSPIVSALPPTGTATCASDAPMEAMGTTVIQPANGGNTELVRVVGATSTSVTIPGQMPEVLFSLVISHLRTVGTPSCSGCNVPVEVRLVSVNFIRGAGCAGCPNTDVAVSDPLSPQSNVAQWQSTLFFLTRITPNFAINTGTTHIDVQGNAIPAGSTVRLLLSGQPAIPGTNVSISASGFFLDADFNLLGVAVGDWNVEVTSPASDVRTLAGVLHIEAPDPGTLQPALAAAYRYRLGRAASIPAGARHTGNIPWTGLAFAAVRMDPGFGPVTLNYLGHPVSTVTPSLPLQTLDVLSLPNLSVKATLLPIGVGFTPPTLQCGNIEYDLYEVSKSAGPTAPAQVVGQLVHDRGVTQGYSWPATSPGFAGALESQLQSELDTRIAAFTSNPAGSLALAEHAEMVRASVEGALTALAGGWAADVTAYRTVWNALSAGAPWTAFRVGMLDTYAAMAAPPAPVALFPCVPSVANFCVLTSWDPNEKDGPLGAGPARAVSAGTPMAYQVKFENKPEATAAAQDVFVTDTLDTSVLDPSTFEFTEFAFGSHVLTPPAGQAAWTTDVDLRPGVNLVVRVAGALDPGSGVVQVSYRSLDPVTLQPTNDPLLGFLPPDVSPPEGEGSVSFTAAQRGGLADGATLANHARIVFDLNPHIDTPVWSNVLDLSPPSSAVASLASAQGYLTFPVSWAGTDAGAGVLDYSVFVSTDGGPYTEWQHHTPATSAPFTGVNGHGYAFYSVARDRVGLVEAAPSTPDAMTTITAGVDGTGAPLVFAILPVRPNPAAGEVNVEFTLPVRSAGSLALYDVTGRCVRLVDIGALAPGRHQAELLDGLPAGPGVYFVRLRQGGHEATRRVVLLH